MKMRRTMLMSLAVLAALAAAVPASAVPRLQTYIVDSRYSVYNSHLDFYSWVSNSNSFDLKVVGNWGDGLTGGSYGSVERPLYRSPAYDYMDCYLAMSVPRNQSGQIFINGVEISAFERWSSAVPAGTSPGLSIPLTGPSLLGGRYNFLDIGRIDNDQMNAYNYGYGRIGSPGWGDEITLDVVVRGFEWAHFDAIGVDSHGHTYVNSPFHDSSYYATPEPSTLSLLGVGLLGIAPLLRRKRKSDSQG
jgi:hypothetical protein